MTRWAGRHSAAVEEVRMVPAPEQPPAIHEERGEDARRLGVAVVGLGGAVATTVATGRELIRLGACGPEGLPLADLRVPDRDGRSRPLEEATGIVA
jgi:hypothetical protein